MKLFALFLSVFLIVSILIQPAHSAERFTFQLMFSSVGVDDELAAEDYDAAIKVLEARALDPNGDYLDNEFATLCALYVITKQYQTAHNTCETAVNTDGSYMAHNNPGVLRVNLNNWNGALEDFGHARIPPEKVQVYVSKMIRNDTRLVAGLNHDEAKRYVELRQPQENVREMLSDRTKGADIEDVSH
jgi:hypothetical protein